MFCLHCTKRIIQHQKETVEKLDKAKSAPEKQQVKFEYAGWFCCPDCGTASRDREEDEVSILSRNAQAGKSWAQLQIGLFTMQGAFGLEKDRGKAAEWFSLAADQGCAAAMSMLSRLWKDGFPERGVPSSNEKADQYITQAARNGSGPDQNTVACKEQDGSEKSLIWHSLAAAQGVPASQHALAHFHMVGSHGMPQSLFAALYWVRKAALQGDAEAQGNLASALLTAKATIYDGLLDIAGYSAVPEARFWLGLHEEGMKKLHQAPMPRHEKLQMIACGHCNKSHHECTALLRCSKCKCICYCSKSCQTQHWKMGHKRDCAGVCVWIDAMKHRPSNIYHTLE
jgi:MYND finger/Sel1 repeat